MQSIHILEQLISGGCFDMITEPYLSFSYDCPKCSRAVGAGCSAFMLDGLNCRCDCGGSFLKASIYGSIMNVEYPCRHCGKMHTAKINFSKLVNIEFTSLVCPETNRECCTVSFSDMGDYSISSKELLAYLSKLFSGISDYTREK